MEYPQEKIESIVKEFLLQRIRDARWKSEDLIMGLLYQTYGLEERARKVGLALLPGGGDWKPDMIQAEPGILQHVLNYVFDQLRAMSEQLDNPDWGNLDLYEFIGRMQPFVEPELIVYGRKHLDQKSETRTYMAKIVKYVLNRLTKDERSPRIYVAQPISLFGIDYIDSSSGIF
jgi:hypothetical protein